MKSFADPSFFRVFELLLGQSNPGLKRARWTYDDVEFERDRTARSGPKYDFTIEVYTLSRAGRRGWSLLVAKEYWWAAPDNEIIRTARWARPTSGRRAEIIAWLRAQEDKVGSG